MIDVRTHAASTGSDASQAPCLLRMSCRSERSPPAAADMLPGSMRGSQEDEEEQGQLPPMQQQQRRTSRGQTSLTMHVLHGVKSGAWDMKAQMEAAAFAEEHD